MFELYVESVKRIAKEYEPYFEVLAHEEGFEIIPSSKHRLSLGGAEIAVTYIDKCNVGWKGIYVVDCNGDERDCLVKYCEWCEDERFEEFINELIVKLNECIDKLCSEFVDYDENKGKYSFTE